MKPIDKYESLTNIETISYQYGQSGGGGSTTYPATYKRRLVSPWSSVSGNFKDPNPWGYSTDEWTYARGSRTTLVDYSNVGGPYWTKTTTSGVLSQYTGGGSVPSPSTQAAYNRALAKVYEKIRESNVNLAVDVAEWRQTARMLSKAARAVRAPLRVFAESVKSRRFRNGFADGRDVAGRWLEYSYGWRPLASTVSDLIQYTQKLENIPFFVKGQASDQIPFNLKGQDRAIQWQLAGTAVARSQIGLMYYVADSYKANASALTSLNPALIAWELVPFSFVIDWFINVGGYLEAMEASLGVGLSFHRGYVSSLTAVDYKGHATESYSFSSPGFRETRTGSGSFYRKTRNFHRGVLQSFPTPMLPTFNCSLSGSRLISSAALLRTTVFGGVKLGGRKPVYTE